MAVPSKPGLTKDQLIRTTPFLLIILFLILVYFNSFEAEWQMDDQPNILDNPGLHINDLTPRTLWETFFANQGKEPKLFRPVACLTFALNWYVDKDDPRGYHLVNFLFHVATAWVLFLLIIRLLTLLGHNRWYEHNSIQGVALLAAIIWAIHPIQTQAVTYIVQRMTIMAAFFYVLGIFSFVKARTAETKFRQWAFGVGCLLCFAGGIGSKENAILLPGSLLLVEWIFFRGAKTTIHHRSRFLLIGTSICVSFFILVYFNYDQFLRYILNGYDIRPFTLSERVLTQPRIVLMYLSQIFLPTPQRLSIAHDVLLSTSIFRPWSTLPAIIVVFGLIGGSILLAKRYPLISFAVLFYFFNHLIESTIFPLELVFEHRNYLPTMFLFLPVAAGIYRIIQHIPQHSRALRGAVIGIVIMLLMGLGLGTHTRNQAWATPESLWRDAALKAPGSMRPLINLGVALGWKDNPTPANLRHAMVLFQHSLDLNPSRVNEKAEILGNMASISFHQGYFESAIELYHQALEVDPTLIKVRFDLVKPLVMAGRFQEAQRQTRYLIDARPNHPDYLSFYGFICLWLEEYDEALVYFQNAMTKRAAKANLLMNLGVALTKTGHWDRGHWFLRHAKIKSPNDPIIFFSLIENRLRAGDFEVAKRYADMLVAVMPVPTLIELLQSLPANHRFPPISGSMVQPVMHKALNSYRESIVFNQ